MTLDSANQLWQKFLRLNFFKKSDSTEQTLRKELIATRVYTCSFITSLITITIITAFIVRTIERTESQPSDTRFTQLAKRYPSTIKCPCSKYAISYQAFMITQVQFHPVCSSRFIEQTWFNMIFTNENISVQSIDDFRVTLSFFWQTIGGLCNASRASWESAVANFQTSNILSPTAIAEETLRVQVQAAFQDQIDFSQTTIIRTLLAIRRMTSGNQIVSGLQTNYYLKFFSSSDIRMTPRTFGNCSCTNIEGCPRPAIFNDSQGHLITIPGMIMDCLIIEATLASTLECYYNQTCISLLHQALPIHIQPLSNSSLKRFSPRSMIEDIFNELMIEEIQSDVKFNLYYSQYDHWNRVAPNLNISKSQATPQRPVHVIYNYIQHIPRHIRELVTSLNVFESARPHTATELFRERLLTKIFILLVIISSLGAGLYIFLTKQNQLITVSNPSLSTYDQLYNDYSTALQCPCSQISVPYKSFMNVTFVLHQVCFSDLVSSEWISYVRLFDPTSANFMSYQPEGTLDFRVMGISYFQLLSTFCSMVQTNIADAQHVFTTTQFINDRVLSRSDFHQKTQSILDSFIKAARDNFVRTIDWIDIAFTAGHFFNGANIIFQMTFDIYDQLNIQFATYFLYSTFSATEGSSSAVCSCAFDYKKCLLIPLLFTNASYFGAFPLTYLFQVITVGCVPLTGFFKSQIGWWYNSTYLKDIQETYSLAIQSQRPPNIKSLNASIPSRFGDVKTEDLLLELFSEAAVSNNSHFDQFYYECAPKSCSYTSVQRRNALASLLLLIAICGGLNAILRIAVLLSGKLLFYCIDWWKERRQRRANSGRHYLTYFLTNIYHSVKRMNLFKSEITDDVTIRRQQMYTRIYLVLYITTISVILFYTAVVERSTSKTYDVSSIGDYSELVKNLRTNDLRCPCTRISISYGEFINELRVNTFHEACTTDVVRSVFYFGMTDSGQSLTSSRNFFGLRKFYSDSLDLLCSLAQKSVENSIHVFLTSTMLTNQLQPLTEFTGEINSTITQFQKRISITFAQTLDLIRMSAQGNALSSMFLLNWNVKSIGNSRVNNVSFVYAPIFVDDENQNTSCSCATVSTCTAPVKYYLDGELFIIPGLKLGCHILETVLLSSFSCFYSSICIKKFLRISFNLPDIPIGNDFRLHESLTRFNVNDTLERITYEMFIESWKSNVSYEDYFKSCSPNYCIHTQYYRFDEMEILTTFLSIFTGTSTGIRLFVPYMVRVFQSIRHRLCRTR
ncbi:unnamed protein product [Adineta ricciae]|uniref:Uncharacterized protein n=1 Tax=Adineta ricciae TaxID=249248 RepID=A0A813S0D0_ADIRI|nr:unnamed protein product [Adineta ricciae]